MADSVVTPILEIANTRHGPAADLDERPLLVDEHDHLSAPSEARAYLSSRGLPVPDVVPTADELDRLRELRYIARAISTEEPDVVHERLERLLARYLYRLSAEGAVVPTGSGWDRLTGAALPGLLELVDMSDRLRTCGNPECGWLFIDQSRNHSRVWCDMGTCGSRAKMTRYRRRKRGSA